MTVEARRWIEQARGAVADIAEEDDRDLVLSDLATIAVTSSGSSSS